MHELADLRGERSGEAGVRMAQGIDRNTGQSVQILSTLAVQRRVPLPW